MLKKIGLMCLSIGLGLGSANVALASETSKTKRASRVAAPVEIKVVAVGPTQEQIDELKLGIERSAAVQKFLGGTEYRLLEFGFLETSDKGTTGFPAPQKYRVAFYDYTNERTIIAVGSVDKANPVSVREEDYQPIPNAEEFEIAVSIVRRNAEFGAALKAQTLKAFRPMPPTTSPDGTNERLINVGLGAIGDSTRNEVVSVSLKRGEVIRYPNYAPPTSKAAPDACGIPDAGQSTSGRGTAGQYQMSVTQNGAPLWDFLVLRPSASSGTRSSGIELRDLKYRGKMVMKRGHAPILNVQYAGGECGPYRDWQYEEDMFQTGTSFTDPAPGVRVLTNGTIATTALETGNDTGNFRGVAIYTQNNETVLITELQAGWYRYIMEWRLGNDGTIRPRFGFGATDDSCVCFVHNHHVYWRFDMDIVNANNNVFQVERGRKFLTPVTTEATMNKNLQTNRSLMVQNATGNEAYLLVPNNTDGIADTYGRGDIWALKYNSVAGGSALQNELDDGYNSTGGGGTAANISRFLTGESLTNQDVVLWYGAHFIHSDGGNLLDPDRSGLVISGAHVVGPDIRPIRW